jgi:hypothetical protein
MKKRPGESDFEALARHTAWRIVALNTGRAPVRAAYTNAAGDFNFSALAACLGMAEDSLRLHFPIFEQQDIDGKVADGAGAQFAARVEWYLAHP